IGQAPWEADYAQDMHRVKRTVEKDEREQEVNLAPVVVHHAAEHLGKPEVNGPEYAHRRTSKEHVMEMGHNEIGVVDKNVNWRRGHKDARQAADDEHRHE